ncbi:hypothetical protein LAZ67_13002496 [Cordylochernes scorpioides]|uniref:Kinase n=1 Tax=Cordylochernes scorpioides TaxID=51811 RepID=A0ABY6L5E7_9ARAC|nr:hypothetical protein LAZ67_13002496 [Cordylochernes scorpioides]
MTLTSPSDFLLLENVTNGFQRPCILDLKMGTRQHGDHAPADKRNRQRAKCAARPITWLEERVTGMYNPGYGSHHHMDNRRECMEGERQFDDFIDLQNPCQQVLPYFQSLISHSMTLTGYCVLELILTLLSPWIRMLHYVLDPVCTRDSRRVRVWRRRGERSNPAAIVERPTVRQRGIMVWGAIAYDSRSPLLRIQGTMTAQRYVDDVLRPVTLPYLQGIPNALYQQDIADRTLLALANKLCKMYRCFPGHRTLLISHQSSTSGTSLDAVCMPCHSRVQKTNCGKWLRGNGEPSLRTPSVL